MAFLLPVLCATCMMLPAADMGCSNCADAVLGVITYLLHLEKGHSSSQ
jgi:hypothetical protein